MLEKDPQYLGRISAHVELTHDGLFRNLIVYLGEESGRQKICLDVKKVG